MEFEEKSYCPWSGASHSVVNQLAILIAFVGPLIDQKQPSNDPDNKNDRMNRRKSTAVPTSTQIQQNCFPINCLQPLPCRIWHPPLHNASYSNFSASSMPTSANNAPYITCVLPQHIWKCVFLCWSDSVRFSWISTWLPCRFFFVIGQIGLTDHRKGHPSHKGGKNILPVRLWRSVQVHQLSPYHYNTCLRLPVPAENLKKGAKRIGPFRNLHFHPDDAGHTKSTKVIAKNFLFAGITTPENFSPFNGYNV